MLSYFIALFFIGYHVQGAVIQDSPVGFGVRATKSIETTCLKNDQADQAEQALDKLDHIKQKCWSLNFLREFESEEEATRLCIEHRENMLHCIHEFLEQFEPCLSSEESYLGKFLLDAYGNYSSYLCEHILVLTNMEASSIECIGQFVKDSSIDPSHVCYEKSEVFGNTASDVVLTKAKLCGDLRSARTCYGEKFENHCPSAVALKELVLELLQHALVPCQDEVSENSVEFSE